MRLSRPRVLIRAALLWVGGAFMLAKALSAHRAARLAGPGGAALLERIALVGALMGLLAVAAGVVALLALRRRPRAHTLHLDDVARPRPPGPRGGDETPPGPGQ